MKDFLSNVFDAAVGYEYGRIGCASRSYGDVRAYTAIIVALVALLLVFVLCHYCFVIMEIRKYKRLRRLHRRVRAMRAQARAAEGEEFRREVERELRAPMRKNTLYDQDKD